MSTPIGLFYVSNIIPKSLEEEILTYFLNNPDEQKAIYTGSRQVRQYGYSYDYGSKGIGAKLPEFPSCISKLLDLVSDDIPVPDNNVHEYFDQCIANRYLPGEGIGKHTDHRSFGNIIVCFTLQSGIEVEFENKNNICKLYVEPRSLYVMSGPSRWYWTHQIRPRKNDTIDNKIIPRSVRWSITFRNVNH